MSISNCVIIRGEQVPLPKALMDNGVTASNYLDDGEPRFAHVSRKHGLVNFVLHETCGNTADGCKDTLLRKKFGVQLIMDPLGHISCHGDLLLDAMVHANQLNPVSIGMEIVNPYSPVYAGKLFQRTAPAEWWTWVPSMRDPVVERIVIKKGWTAVPRQYCLPTDAQMNAIRLFVPWVCGQVCIPYVFPTRDLCAKKRQNARPGPGVVAHRDFSTHSDGRYMLEDLIRRS